MEVAKQWREREKGRDRDGETERMENGKKLGTETPVCRKGK